jgi:hypothetical protein
LTASPIDIEPSAALAPSAASRASRSARCAGWSVRAVIAAASAVGTARAL